MRATPRFGLALALAAVACGGGKGVVVVNVSSSGVVSGVDHLAVTVHNGGMNANVTVNFPSAPVTVSATSVQSFALSFASDRSGGVAVDLDAVDAHGTRLAHGTGSATLTPGADSTIAVVLPGEGMADMTVPGDGATRMDAAVGDDLATPSDLAVTGDAAVPVDGTALPDLTVDGTVLPDLILPDLAMPCSVNAGTDIYVAPSGNDANTGGAASCPMQTLTAALRLADQKGWNNVTVHLAAGTYSTGETFPLVLHHGNSLVGPSGGGAIVQGSGMYDSSGSGNGLETTTASNNIYQVTLIAGDPTIRGTSTVANVTLLPAATYTAPTARVVGVVCTQGNAPMIGSQLSSLPTPSLRLDHLTVGPNYDVGVHLTYVTQPASGCNALVTASSFTGNNDAVITGGCGLSDPSSSWTATQLGDGLAGDGNRFSSLHDSVAVGGCSSVSAINGNSFVAGAMRGVVTINVDPKTIAGSNYTHDVEIVGNTFDGQAIGVHVGASSLITRLDRNVFSNNTETAASDAYLGTLPGAGLRLCDNAACNVIEAKGNTFKGNDNGVMINGPAFTAARMSFNFSSAGVAADANVFSCNSRLSTGIGYDVAANVATGSTVTLDFSGNQWDHASPTTTMGSGTGSNGTDLETNNITVITTGATFDNVVNCPGGHVK